MEKNKIMMIAIIVLLVLLLGTIVGVSVFALKYLSGKDVEDTSLNAPPAQEVKMLKPNEIEVINLQDPLNCNLLIGADNVEHIVQVKIGVGVDNTDKKKSPETIANVTANDTVIRDLAIGVIKKLQYQDLIRPDGQDILRDKLFKAIQGAFADNLIVTVYVSDMYLQ